MALGLGEEGPRFDTDWSGSLFPLKSDSCSPLIRGMIVRLQVLAVRREPDVSRGWAAESSDVHWASSRSLAANRLIVGIDE